MTNNRDDHLDAAALIIAAAYNERLHAANDPSMCVRRDAVFEGFQPAIS